MSAACVSRAKGAKCTKRLFDRVPPNERKGERPPAPTTRVNEQAARARASTYCVLLVGVVVVIIVVVVVVVVVLVSAKREAAANLKKWPLRSRRPAACVRRFFVVFPFVRSSSLRRPLVFSAIWHRLAPSIRFQPTALCCRSTSERSLSASSSSSSSPSSSSSSLSLAAVVGAR